MDSHCKQIKSLPAHHILSANICIWRIDCNLLVISLRISITVVRTNIILLVDSSEPIVTNQLTTGYNDNTDGTVFALVGTGGESFYPLASQAPYVASQFDKFGFLNIDISNGNPHTKLTGTFYDNKGDAILDQFTIEKEIKNTDVDIQPVSLSASHASQNALIFCCNKKE